MADIFIGLIARHHQLLPLPYPSNRTLSPRLDNHSPNPELACPLSTLIMRCTLLLVAALSNFAASASIASRENHAWPAPVRDYYSAVGRRVAAVKKTINATPPACDVASAVPPVAPTPLPSPSPGLAVYHVAIGRGTQVSILIHCRPSNSRGPNPP